MLNNESSGFAVVQNISCGTLKHNIQQSLQSQPIRPGRVGIVLQIPHLGR